MGITCLRVIPDPEGDATRNRTILAAAVLGAGAASAATPDFEGFAAGRAVTGVPVGGANATASADSDGEVDRAVIIVTLDPAGGDTDLDVSDPAGPQFGNVLIIQENEGEPDDEMRGGTIIFAFDRPIAFDGPITFDGLDDVDVTVTADTGAMASLTVLADGGSGSLSGLGFAGVSTPTLDCSGSGAIDDLQISTIPVWAALPLPGLAPRSTGYGPGAVSGAGP